MNKADNYDAPIFADGAFARDYDSGGLKELGLLGIASYTEALTGNHLENKIHSGTRNIIFNKLLSSLR